MEMWQKWSTLVLLTVMVISAQDAITLDKGQRTVNVPSGSPLNLNCSLNTTGYERFRVTWFFIPSGSDDQKSLSLKPEVFVNRAAKTSTVVKDDGQHDQKILLNYTSSATDKDSGLYFCEIKVDIPRYESINSNRTKVVITKSVEHTTHPSLLIVTSEQATVSPEDKFQLINWWLWIFVGVSTFVLIILIIICIVVRRFRRSRGEDPIYINTRPSPRPGSSVDNLKTVSSSQNLRNPSPGRRYEEGKRRYKE